MAFINKNLSIDQCADKFASALQNWAECHQNILLNPFGVIITKSTNRLDPVGDVPTSAEIAASILAGYSIIYNFTGGTVPAPTFTEKTGNDTYTGMPEQFNVMQTVTSQIKVINNKSLLAIKKNNASFKAAYIHIFSREGRIIFGGKHGVLSNCQLLPPQQPVYNEPAFIDKIWSFYDDPDHYLSIGEIDEGLLALENLVTEGTITLTGDAAPSFKPQSFLNLTGWNKILYPNLYGKITPDIQTATIYSDAARTLSVATVELADPALVGTVTATNTSGFGGSIEVTAVTPTLNDLLVIAYS